MIKFWKALKAMVAKLYDTLGIKPKCRKERPMAINEADFHKHQRRLHKAIQDLEAMRVECCETGQCEARDNLGMVLGHLHMANAIGGKIVMSDSDENVIRPLGGGK